MKFLALTLIAAVFAGSTAFASESVDEQPVKRYRPAPQVQQQPNDDYQDYNDQQSDGYAQGGYAQGGYAQGGYVQGGYAQQGCCGHAQVPPPAACCGAYPPPVLPANPVYPQREMCWVTINPHNWGIQSNLRGVVASGLNWQRGRIAYMRQVLMAQGCLFTN
jgi:hypothetical protein